MIFEMTAIAPASNEPTVMAPACDQPLLALDTHDNLHPAIMVFALLAPRSWHSAGKKHSGIMPGRSRRVVGDSPNTDA